ncbi:16252_t:CDS:1, partial [Gigaspora margarita]
MNSYIYTGIFSVENNVCLVDIFISADEIELLELCKQIKKHLLETESAWKFPKDFITLCQHNVIDLYNVAIYLVCKNPKVVFESKEFLELGEDHLISLLKSDDLRLDEIEIWDYLVKWGIKNSNYILTGDLTNWNPTDFVELEKTIHNCIPHIRFSQMSLHELRSIKIKYKTILPDLSDEIFSTLDPRHDLLQKRVSAYPFDSKIIDAKDATLIATWIDNKQGMPYHFKEIPFKFECIYRASEESFSINKFHENCDNKGPTVVIIKVRNSGEIIGGYNPLDWRSVKLTNNENRLLPSNIYNNYRCKTSKSFIFSLLSFSKGAIPRLSRISTKNEAIIWCNNKGPCFGSQDLWIQNNSSRGSAS